MNYQYDKDVIKQNLTIEQVADYVAELGGEPKINGNIIYCKTICHCGESHKLYYYGNTQLFKCFTDCPEDSFDIFQLTQKIKSKDNLTWNFTMSIAYVAQYFGYAPVIDTDGFERPIADWSVFNDYDKIIHQQQNQQKVELKIFDEAILKYLPHPKITPWLDEGISQEVIDRAHICYNPVSQAIVIPHYDIDNNLIGIRERTLIKEVEQYGKYKPMKLSGQMYNHPLSFALYNLNNSKKNIKVAKKAFIFEGEKSCLLYASIFGIDNDISVAVCGSNLINYQVKLLLTQGVKEIVICFDRQFQEIGDEEYKKWTTKLKEIHQKYSKFVQISFVFDKFNMLGYKMSPIDAGADTFLYLYKHRIIL